MYLTLALIVVFVACVGVLYTEGMWSNALRLVNVVTAALLATNFYEPIATWLDGQVHSLSYVWDFAVLWGLFALFAVAFRAATEFVSKVKVRFLKLADRIGGIVFAALIGWVMVCFTGMTLHTAPLPREFLGYKPEQKMLLGVMPDRQWLAVVQRLSRGQFCQSPTAEQRKRDEWKQEKLAVFDPKNDFLLKYATRRAKLEEQLSGPSGSLLAK